MKPLIISRSSWHYQLARLCNYEYAIPNDICGYLRTIALSIFTVSATIFIAIGATFCLSQFLGAVAAMLISLSLIELDTAAGVGLAIIVLGEIIGLIALGSWLGDRPRQEKEPTFIGAAWDSIHNKICIRVTFK